MVSIQESYGELKKGHGEKIARELLLLCHEQSLGNVSETARQMRCNRRTVMKALRKQSQGDLGDMPHVPHVQPNKTSDEVEAKVLAWRTRTKRGKRMLKKIMEDEEGISLCVSTIGKILKRNKVKMRERKRKHRSSNPPAYDFSTLLPFEKWQYDTKHILDMQALKLPLYEHVLRWKLPPYQWTIIDVKSRTRFLAFSYQPTRGNGMAFELLVKAWLSMHGLAHGEIEVQSDGGGEVGALRAKSFERNKKLWWDALGMKRKVIRKGHPEDDSFVERSHLTDDEEFYIPFLNQITNEQQLISRAVWWEDYYNRERAHQSLGDRSPYEYLKSKGYVLPESFCRFPCVILDAVSAEPEVLEWQKVVYDQFDHHQCQEHRGTLTEDRREKIIFCESASVFERTCNLLSPRHWDIP